jgi:hypothetical protein
VHVKEKSIALAKAEEAPLLRAFREAPAPVGVAAE